MNGVTESQARILSTVDELRDANPEKKSAWVFAEAAQRLGILATSLETTYYYARKKAREAAPPAPVELAVVEHPAIRPADRREKPFVVVLPQELEGKQKLYDDVQLVMDEKGLEEYAAAKVAKIDWNVYCECKRAAVDAQERAKRDAVIESSMDTQEICANQVRQWSMIEALKSERKITRAIQKKINELSAIVVEGNVK